jgi:hypothetical protein
MTTDSKLGVNAIIENIFADLLAWSLLSKKIGVRPTIS